MSSLNILYIILFLSFIFFSHAVSPLGSFNSTIGNWETTAPVATNETCEWTSSSVCTNNFFSAYGKYNESWSGSVYFNTPNFDTNTVSLSVQLFGSFSNQNESLEIPILINGVQWNIWYYGSDYISNCTIGTDAVIFVGSTEGLNLTTNDSNLLTFQIPDNGPDIHACGAIVSGSYQPSNTPTVSISPSISITPTQTISISPSISITPSISPNVTGNLTSISPSTNITPSNSSTPSVTSSNSNTPSLTPSLVLEFWQTTAPVATAETCEWTAFSTCKNFFFSAYGKYNESWSGSIYFNNKAPFQATVSLTVQLFGSFSNQNESLEIPILINGVQWNIWYYGSDYISNCTIGTDVVILSGSTEGLTLTTDDSNLLTFQIPDNGPDIHACGAIVSGFYTSVDVSQSTSPSITPTISITPTSTISLSGTPSPSTNSTIIPQSSDDFAWWGVTIVVFIIVIIIIIATIFGGISFYKWKSKQLNGYAIMG